MLIYGTSLAFNYIATSYFIKKWFNGVASPEAISVAGEAMGLPFLIAAILIPIFGFIGDKYQNRVNLLIISAICGFIAFINFIYISPALGLLCFGSCFSLANSIVAPSISLIIPMEALSIAFSINTSLINLATSIFPLIISYIHSQSKNFDVTLKFFLVTTFTAIILAVLLLFEDKKRKNILNGNSESLESQANKFIPTKPTPPDYNTCTVSNDQFSYKASNYNQLKESSEQILKPISNQTNESSQANKNLYSKKMKVLDGKLGVMELDNTDDENDEFDINIKDKELKSYAGDLVKERSETI